MATKVRNPKSRTGLMVNVVELEYGCELRLSMEIFHEQGKYSSAMTTLKMRAIVNENIDPAHATKELINLVHEKIDESMRERIEATLEDINTGSFR